MTIKFQLMQAMGLLERAANSLVDSPLQDRDWWKNYYQLTGKHMILTEEGWEDGSAKQTYIDSLEPNEGIADVILDEVNAPKNRGRKVGSKNKPKDLPVTAE